MSMIQRRLGDILVERADDLDEWLLTWGEGLEGGTQKRSSWLLLDLPMNEQFNFDGCKG